MVQAAVAAFLDKEAAAAVVLAYADALDARDWEAFRSLFTEDIMVDYEAIGSLASTISADEWTERCRTLEGFDATAHRIQNVVVTVDGDVAKVVSVVDAAHFVTVGHDVLMGDLIGRYTHYLHRQGGWKIAAVVLTVAGYPAGKPAFDAVFIAARQIHAERDT